MSFDISSMIGAVGSIGMGIAQSSGLFDNRQYEQQKRLSELQLVQNKRATDYAIERNSYKEQVKRMKEAGLNPALLYGMGGGAGGTAQSVQGVSGGNASGASERTANMINSMGMALQLQKLKSEIDVNKSVANANNASVPVKDSEVKSNLQGIEESKAKIDNIVQQTENERTKGKLLGLQSDFQEIINGFQGKLSKTTIDKMEADISYLTQDTRRLFLQNDITSQAKSELIMNYFLQNTAILSQIGVNDAKIKEINQNITLMGTNIDLNKAMKIGKDIDNAIQGIEKRNTIGSGMKEQGGTFGAIINGLRTGVRSITELIQGYNF